MWIRQLRLPIINRAELMKVGEWGAAHVLIPLPYPHSSLNPQSILSLIDKSYEYFMLKSHDIAEQLQRELAVIKKYQEHLKLENKNLLENMRDIDKRAAARIQMSLPSSLVEKYERTIRNTRNQWIAISIFLAVIAFAIGFLVAGGNLSVVPAGNQTVTGP